MCTAVLYQRATTGNMGLGQCTPRDNVRTGKKNKNIATRKHSVNPHVTGTGTCYESCAVASCQRLLFCLESRAENKLIRIAIYLLEYKMLALQYHRSTGVSQQYKKRGPTNAKERDDEQQRCTRLGPRYHEKWLIVPTTKYIVIPGKIREFFKNFPRRLELRAPVTVTVQSQVCLILRPNRRSCTKAHRTLMLQLLRHIGHGNS